MKTGNDELGALGYVSSAPDLVKRDEPHPIDEAEINTLDEVMKLLAERKASYSTISALSLEPEIVKLFTVEQQLAVNKKVVFHLQELETKISTVIKKVRDKQNGQ